MASGVGAGGGGASITLAKNESIPVKLEHLCIGSSIPISVVAVRADAGPPPPSPGPDPAPGEGPALASPRSPAVDPLLSSLGLVTAAVNYLRGLLDTGNTKFLLFLTLARRQRQEVSPEVVLEICLNLGLVDGLCRILPKPFLRVTIHEHVGASGAPGATEFEATFDLTEILEKHSNQSSPFSGRFARSQYGPGRDLTGTVKRCDVIVGWSMPDEVRPMSVKIGSRTFMDNLFQQEGSKELKIVAGNGATVKCHRIVFEAQSDVLAAMISTTNGMVESTSGTINMLENSEEGLSLLIGYFYGNELTINDLSSVDIAVELFKTADKYLLTKLKEFVGDELLHRDGDWFTPGSLVELYFHVNNLEEGKQLQDHCLNLMLGLSDEIKSSERFQDAIQTNPVAANELVWKLLDLEKKQKPAAPVPIQVAKSRTPKRGRRT